MVCARSATDGRATTAATLGLLLALAATGCGVVRPSDFAPVCPKYDTSVQGVLTARCGSCHAEGTDTGYRVDSYLRAIQPREDGVRLVAPGEPDSGVLQAARGETPPHARVSDADLAILTTWVVSCNGAPSNTEYHPTGWGSPLNGELFHGAVLRSKGYLTFECQACHGQDLRGGKARVDCNGCHLQGPFACNTCHGDETSPAPPRALDNGWSRTSRGVGAHRAHVTDNALHAALQCGSCHPTFTSAEDEGHYRIGGAFVTDRPAVQLPAVPDSGMPAVWDRTAATCSNVACHTPNRLDTNATRPTPVWTSITGEASRCGACHGLGPLGHTSTHCDGCHTPGYADGGVDLAVHLNGRVDLGSGTRCDVCHAPPGTQDFHDTHGQTDETLQTVGAHTAHLTSATFRGPLGCQDCHLVPASAFSPNHVELAAPAPVFPAGWDGGLARHDGTSPAYDPASATCASVYCHGNGARLVAADRTPGLIRSPRWTGAETQAFCGSCHGTPPADGRLGHGSTTTIGDCAQCHALSVNPDGGIRFQALSDGGVSSFHLDGVVNGNH